MSACKRSYSEVRAGAVSVSMTSKVLCRYHMNGMCNKGEQCAFSHDFAAMPSQTCRYYLAGCCAYGDQCRFDHVRIIAIS